MKDSLNRDGFAVVFNALDRSAVQALIAATSAAQEHVCQRDGRVYALRNLLVIPAVRELAESRAVRDLVEPTLGRAARVVRGIFFDKTPGANWKVAWHQDVSIAVKQRVDVEGFGPWSTKAGVVHVQPPREILDAMLTVRLHLDTCGEQNGPLKVIPGSQARGVLPPDEVAAMLQQGTVATCAVPRGGAVMMRPLILHASSSAQSPAHRRVIHLEFCGIGLPGGLEWAFSMGEIKQ